MTTRITGSEELSSSSCPSSSSFPSSSSCPICLESIKDEAYLDQCFHSFCYNCIQRWIKVVSRKHSQTVSSVGCPLCKRENFSIVHSFSHNYFERHYINQDERKNFSSMAHILRWRCYGNDPGILRDKLNVQFYWKHRRYLKRSKWLEQWLTREIQTLTKLEDVDVIVQHILGVHDAFLKRQPHEIFSGTYEQKREEFKALIRDIAKPFLSERSDRFVDELEFFLVSGLTIEAYDKLYMEAMGASGLRSEIVEPPAAD